MKKTTRTAQQNGRRSRRKGKVAERAIAALYREAGFNARRGAQNKGTPDTPDVEVTDLPLLHIESKCGARIALWDAIRQAEQDAGTGKVPVVHLRRDRWPTYVVLRFDAFVEILRDGMEALGSETAPQSVLEPTAAVITHTPPENEREDGKAGHDEAEKRADAPRRVPVFCWWRVSNEGAVSECGHWFDDPDQAATMRARQEREGEVGACGYCGKPIFVVPS